MSLHVLDTDTLTLLQECHANVLAKVAACKPDDIAITVLSVEEQLSGWYRRLRKAKKEEELAKVYDRLTTTIRSLARLPILSFSHTAIRRAKTLSCKTQRSQNGLEHRSNCLGTSSNPGLAQHT
jgi:tRNA(fMet)-specific endonuclease VapC